VEDTDILSGDKAALYQADAKEIPYPFGILGIVFVSLYSLDPFGISDDDPDAPLFQDVEDGDPVLPGGLHADVKAGVFMEPVGKAVQI